MAVSPDGSSAVVTTGGAGSIYAWGSNTPAPTFAPPPPDAPVQPVTTNYVCGPEASANSPSIDTE